MTSALKSLLQMNEVPFPPLLLITDEVNSASAAPMSKLLLDKFIGEESYSIHCVYGSPFAEPLSSSDKVTHYHPSFTKYGEDPTAFENFMSSYRSSHPRKTSNSMPQLFNVSSKAFECHENTSVKNLENVKPVLENLRTDEKECVCKTMVLVDRVEDILLHTSARHVLLSCREVTEDGGIVILVCSSSIVLPSALQHLKYAASSVVMLTSVEDLSRPCHWLGIADVVIRRQTGKIIKSREFYHIDLKSQTISTALAPPSSSYSFSAFPAVELAPKETTTPIGSSFTKNLVPENRSAGKGAPKISLKSTDSVTDVGGDGMQVAKLGDGASEGDPEQQTINALASQATFSLRLSDEERKAKNNLLLPHQRVQRSSTGGVVLYTPDSEDWDEEDPDDDLDI